MLEAAVARALLMNDRHIAITGASGWMGRATIDLLARVFGESFEDRVSCYGSGYRDIDLGDGRRVTQQPLTELSKLRARQIWVLHFAFKTKEHAGTMDEGAYRRANVEISDTVLDAFRHIDVEAVFLASSGAATKAQDLTASPAMRLYGAMKRNDEALFASWAIEHGRRAVIGRIFNITGPYINKHEAYAIASFIRDALAARPIHVHASREVIRAYVAIRELMSLVFALLGDPRDGVVRFESGGEPLELGSVAQIVARTLGGGIVDRAMITDPIPDRYVGNAAAYSELLERHSIHSVPLNVQVCETAPFTRIPERQLSSPER
ncbi:MAG: hypothetical protein JWO15_282 [Sphingomonadales bacterium]|nr:hypothetical protein [Sphingomonadales bacterium]